jgi:DNA-binding MarR family transcriptional regulator
VGQFSILANISRSGPLSVRELADLSELERSTLARNLKPILAKGWIVDSKALSARNSRLSLTEKGQKVLAEARELWERAQKEVQDRLGEEGVKAFDLIAEALSGDPD